MMNGPAENTLYKALWHAYFANSNDGVFVLGDTLRFIDINQRLQAWMGPSGVAADGADSYPPLSDLFGTGRALRVFREQAARALHGQPVRFESHLQPRRGTARWVEISLNRAVLDDRQVLIGVARDITERHQLIAALEQQANYDDLTGLCNRRNFTRHLERLLHSAKSGERQHALVYIDLDHFKVINDTWGHTVGDRFLARLAGALLPRVRRSDVIARIGGDEFAVLLEDCVVERALQVAEGLRAAVAELRFEWDDRVFHTTASIGVTAINAERSDTAQLLSFADAACYVAKDNGRNSVQLYFGGAKCSRKRAEMDWVTRINEAFEQRRFRLYYQKIAPIVDNCARSEHCEVLLRMVDAQGQIIPPMEFIPAAEKYDLMPAVDRWVIETLLCAKAREWRDTWNDCARLQQQCSLLYAVNISGASINDTGFLEFLLDQITSHRVPPGVLCLEITETMAIANMEKARQFIERARAAGCRIALDDFGSGMSSFAYLKNLPVDFLKIDGSLIRHIADDAADLGIVEAVNRIGHLLGFKTVAEFVEDGAILEVLRRVGVDYAQGYGIHKPEPLLLDPPLGLTALGH